jgi:Holliday junction resolvasome RuvABC ATP-dependent DNA helicase subunit
VPDDDLVRTLDELVELSVASPVDVRAEAAALAAAISWVSPGAGPAWAEAFGLPVGEFANAADVGEAYAEAPTPVLADLNATVGGDPAVRQAYGRRLAELGMAAASLGELTISALAKATVIGNAQLSFAGTAMPEVPGRRDGSGRGTAPVVTPGTQRATDGAVPDAVVDDDTDGETDDAPSLEVLLAELDALVGLDAVKTEVRHQTQVLRIQALRDSAGLRNPELTRHLVFVGNPGTGKTTVARLVAGIYRAVGLLPKGHLVECDRSELVAGYVGQTAIKTAEVISRAIGGALFIDEAYALAGDDFGGEAVDTLVKEMEDHRDELLVIVAGYPAPMGRFIASNPGLESRFRLTLSFDDYSDDELVEIFRRIASGADFTPTDAALDHLREMLRVEPRTEGFGNGRFVRNLFESAVVRQAWRLRELVDPDVARLRELRPDDIDAALADPAPVPEERP